ncbi:MAG TPA: PqqD family peptide modification chaperone [Longimicrobiaceae bacterium]|nr:PqqD family peptide modification chaperone [Longimicrobiaceae bacterium]
MGLDTVVRAGTEQVAAEVEDEVVILNLRDDVYYGLSLVGRRIWELVQQPRTLRDLRDTLLAEYEVDPAECERDLRDLLDDLARRGLVEVARPPAA